jgi:hypothetical protein
MKQKTEIFNEVRMAYMNQPLTGKEIKTLLSELPYGKTDVFLMALVSTGCIEHPNKGTYIFTSHPIHHDLLDKAFAYVKKKNKQYNDKNRKKPVKEVIETKSEIQKAIELLLATGEYEIYRIEKIVKKTQIR